MSLVFGGIGTLLYIYGLYNVGGFVQAYSTAKGGGWAASGYLRDFKILVVPAIVLLYLSRGKNEWRPLHTALLVLFSSPLLVHGLLGARRGPTFMGITVLVAGWYITRHRRPKLWQVLMGGVGVGLLLLVLVTFRSQIYIGSSFLTGEGPAPTQVVQESLERTDKASYGNEYVYGGLSALGARARGDFFWGARYMAYVFVRPIPSAIWPTKYQDVGVGEITGNAGTMAFARAESGRQVPAGAAPGFASDLYLEFGWGAVLAAFLIGALYGWVWRRHLTTGGFWTVIHVALLVFSVYLISQTMEAVIFRFLEVYLPTLMGWKYLGNHYLASRNPQVARA
jgi:hypothetical protein